MSFLVVAFTDKTPPFALSVSIEMAPLKLLLKTMVAKFFARVESFGAFLEETICFWTVIPSETSWLIFPSCHKLRRLSN